MIDENDIKKIKEATEEFLKLATISPLRIEAFSSGKSPDSDVVDLEIKLSEPQILIGEKGQTLFELQRILRMFLNRRLKKIFYLNLDINEYKKSKAEYLKDIAKDLADEVALTKKEKVLVPMSAYERRIIHSEIAQRQDVITESSGDGQDRHVIIKPK